MTDESTGTPPHPPRVNVFLRISPIGYALLSLAVVFILYQGIAGGITLFIAQWKITEENVTLVRWATIVGQLGFILLPTLVLARLRTAHLREYFRFHLADALLIPVTTVAVFSLQQVLQAYMVLQDSIHFPQQIQQFIDMYRDLFDSTYQILVVAHTPLEFLVVVLTVALVPAVCEELLFRGLVQREFETALGGLRGAIVTGIVFGAYHLNPFSIVPLVALGVYFGWIVHRSQNITLAISVHFFNNFIAVVAAYLSLKDDFLAIAPASAATPRLVFLNAILFAAIFIGATYLFVRMTAPEEEQENDYE